ncbi:[Pyruvate Dehydrogenase [Acetyl-Transferring]]-Phosphatase 2, partial [Manis pentadactyla]
MVESSTCFLWQSRSETSCVQQNSDLFGMIDGGAREVMTRLTGNGKETKNMN